MKQKSKFRGTNIITLLAFMTGLQAATDALHFRGILDLVVEGVMATWLLFSVVGLIRRRMWGVGRADQPALEHSSKPLIGAWHV